MITGILALSDNLKRSVFIENMAISDKTGKLYRPCNASPKVLIWV